MLRKLPLGAFVLLALLLVAFRSIIRKRKMRPQLNNNRFALIQPVQKRNWKGQVGKTPDGFLTFQTVVDGVRAGFINLFQTYINAGFNTIAKIFDSNRAFPVYGDPGKGKLYTDLVSKFTAIAPDKVLTLEDVKKVGKAIARVEGGANWVSNEDFDLGFQMAKSYLKI